MSQDDPICTAAGPQVAPIAVNIEFEGQEASITIHNTFAEPEIKPAVQIVAQPAFTGCIVPGRARSRE